MNPDIDPERRAYQVLSLIRCAMIAEENDTSGLEWKGIAEVLALAEELMDAILDSLDAPEKKRLRRDVAA